MVGLFSVGIGYDEELEEHQPDDFRGESEEAEPGIIGWSRRICRFKRSTSPQVFYIGGNAIMEEFQRNWCKGLRTVKTKTSE